MDYDHRPQHLESLESGRRGLRPSQLVLMADALVLRRCRQLHVPQRAQVREIPKCALRVHGVGGGLRSSSRFNVSSQLRLNSKVDLVGYPSEGVVESDGTELLLQSGDPARVDRRRLAAKRAHDPRLGRWARGADLAGLVHHSDRGVQYLAIRYTERLADAGAVNSVGSKGDSYDNALAESVNGLYKAELIRRQRSWRSVEEVELATAGWVDWWNERRLHSACGDIPPAEFEAAYARLPEVTITRLSSKVLSLHETQGGSDGPSIRGVARLGTSKREDT